MFHRKRKPSEVLARILDGTGGGREFDDYLNAYFSDEEEEKFMAPLTEISMKYATGLRPGFMNPDAANELRTLAERLRSEGL